MHAGGGGRGSGRLGRQAMRACAHEGILGKLAEPFFSSLCAEEQVATGGTEWSTLTKRGFLFQCTIASAAIARGGKIAPRTLRQSWQQQPSANTKRASRTAAQHSRPDCVMNHSRLQARLWPVSNRLSNQRPTEVSNLPAIKPT